LHWVVGNVFSGKNKGVDKLQSIAKIQISYLIAQLMIATGNGLVELSHAQAEGGCGHALGGKTKIVASLKKIDV
jgi:hypothetical protein